MNKEKHTLESDIPTDNEISSKYKECPQCHEIKLLDEFVFDMVCEDCFIRYHEPKLEKVTE